MPLSLTIAAQPRLAQTERLAMKALYDRYYHGAEEDAFFCDLDEKDFVILLLDDARVVGFSTQKIHTFPETADVYLFSGDTVVDAPYWNQPGLSGAFGHLMIHLNQHFPPERLFWFLISKGPRTYRYLPTFYHRYFPGQEGDATLKDRRDFIAQKRFGHQADPTTGIIRFTGAKDRLRPEWAETGRADANTRYFEAANPGWREGHELGCLVPLALDNMNRLGHRVIAATDPHWRL